MFKRVRDSNPLKIEIEKLIISTPTYYKMWVRTPQLQLYDDDKKEYNLEYCVTFETLFCCCAKWDFFRLYNNLNTWGFFFYQLDKQLLLFFVQIEESGFAGSVPTVNDSTNGMKQTNRHMLVTLIGFSRYWAKVE